MNELMLAVLGFATVIAIITLLLKNLTTPALAFISVSSVTAAILVVTGTFSVEEMGDFISSGVAGTSSTACLFLFSVLYFGIMTDAGMFDRIINALVSRVGNSVVGVTMMTCTIAMIGHLDGGGASTFLITIPAMLPIYKKLHIRSTTLLLICVTAMGVMNLLPWGGPTLRAASVLGIDANQLWIELIPMQIVGVILAFSTAFIWGHIELRRGAGLNGKLALSGEVEDTSNLETTEKDHSLVRPQYFFFNITLTLVVILSLVLLPLPTYFPFMLGSGVALMVNYSGSKLQSKIIKSHSGPAIMMASTLFGAGVFLGTLEDSGIMDHMATVVATLLPAALGAYLPLIIGALSVPLALAFCTDSYFYGLLPVLIGVGNAFGVDPIQTGISMVVCKNLATFISPVVPATFLGTGLAGVEIKDHIKACFFWIWGCSIICLVCGVLLGIISI